MQPYITVIMPSLNVIDYISECMDSVCGQSFSDIEILCIDACSDDGTFEYLKTCEKKDKRVRVISSSKKSYGYQVNLGLQEACGKYIAIVETDDYIDKDMFLNLHKVAEKYDLDYVKADFDIIYNDTSGKTLKNVRVFSQNSSLYNKLINPADYEMIIKKDVNLWEGIYKRKFLLENGITFHETLGAAFQDIGFTMQVLQKARSAFYVPKSYYRYRLNRKGSSSVNSNVLNYVCQEFKWLFENKIIDKTEGVYSRLAAAFWDELNELFIKLAYNTESSYISKPYIWIKNELWDAICNGKLSSRLFQKEEWFEILFAINDLKGYASYCRIRQKTNEMQCEEIKHLIGEEKLIVFGSGVYGKKVKSLFENLGRKITTFTDNNSRLWGQEIEGITVMPPEQCYIAHKEAAYVVASKKYAEEIYEQLCMNGIRKIYIWK